MDLAEYLKSNKISLAQLAKQCGTSASTILRIKDRDVAPSKRVARALWEATKGQVTPNDLYGLHYSVPQIDDDKIIRGGSADER